MIDGLDIRSPKRNKRTQSGWEGFFPYYAGYTEAFARALLKSARLPADAVVLDPWNGSGTTTYAASLLGIKSCGFDLNPVMIIVARARLLAPSEADSIEPLAREIVGFAQSHNGLGTSDDPLSWWFSDEASASIRAIEESIRHHLIGEMTVTPGGIKLDHISGLSATFYVALFAVCRKFTSPFLTSNPTWLRRPNAAEQKMDVSQRLIEESFLGNLHDMALALASRRGLPFDERGAGEVKLVDTTEADLQHDSIDLILTSPPYCTRIDYTAATRIELAVVAPLWPIIPEELGRQMIGSTRVPTREIDEARTWGPRCIAFLHDVRNHYSKASSVYYYKLYLDYFDKMARSLSRLVISLKPTGGAVFVVQDSYYKDVHNDLPSIIAEMGEAHGLRSDHRKDFRMNRSMSGINRYARVYNRSTDPVEAVLCFSKS